MLPAYLRNQCPPYAHSGQQAVGLMVSLRMTGRIAIVGSRGLPRPDLIEAFVASLPAGTVVVSGGARGVDTVAEQAARERVNDGGKAQH